MISGRTKWIGLVTVLLLVTLSVLFHQRQAVCAEVRHGFARRAPIAGASGTDTFVCHAMIEHLPVKDVVVVVASWFSFIALLRSVWIDLERVRGQRSRTENGSDLYDE